jgi:hypothetical protein
MKRIHDDERANVDGIVADDHDGVAAKGRVRTWVWIRS